MSTLCILGSGIKTIAHITIESQEFIKNADIVLHLLNEPIMKEYVTKLAKKSIDLQDTYYSVDSRKLCYKLITNKIIEQFEHHKNVCVIFYGHPIFCVNPAQAAINIAKENGINVISCPGISSLDCLFSDLNIDPAEHGMQIYTADDLINNQHIINIKSTLVILQAGFINFDMHVHQSKNENLNILVDHLMKFYAEDQICIIYEASLYPDINPLKKKTQLNSLKNSKISSISTLIIKPDV
jgi:uncharacterized protein YabN with tetrapyrrole methylase and pyrophosphatase domain